MNGKNFMLYVLDQSQQTYQGWKELKERLFVPNRDFDEYEKLLDEAESLMEEADKLRESQKKAIQSRNLAMYELWRTIQYIREQAKETFGNESTEMEKFGGQQFRFKKIETN